MHLAAAASLPSAATPRSDLAQARPASCTAENGHRATAHAGPVPGLKFLVDLRADLRDCIRAAPSGAAPLRALSEALRLRPVSVAGLKLCLLWVSTAGCSAGEQAFLDAASSLAGRVTLP